MWFFSSCGGILELRRGSQPSPWVGPGKPNLPLGLRGKAGGGARVTAGPKRPHLSVCPGPNFPLQGRQGSRGCIPGSPGESGLVSRGSQGDSKNRWKRTFKGRKINSAINVIWNQSKKIYLEETTSPNRGNADIPLANERMFCIQFLWQDFKLKNAKG